MKRCAMRFAQRNDFAKDCAFWLRWARQPVSRVLYGIAAVAIIPLGRPLPDGSRNLPERSGAAMPCPVSRARRSYLVLLLVGLAVPFPLPETRCALTAPFHPYLNALRRFAFCGAIPKVTLGGRYPPPYCRGARTFLEQVNLSRDRPAVWPAALVRVSAAKIKPLIPDGAARDNHHERRQWRYTASRE